MRGDDPEVEVPEPELEGLLRKLSWALRQERAGTPGDSVARYRIDRRFVEVALDLIRDAAERHREGYRRFMHGGGKA